MTYREAALRWAQTQVGVHEVGFNNRGPQVDWYQRYGAEYVGWVGFPWCAAFVMSALRKAGFDVAKIPNRASVGYMESHARAAGWLVDRPLRGDVWCWQLDAGNEWPDHTGFVEKVLSLGPLGWWCTTVEGNTSPGDGGSQDDGGGVYRRKRFFRKGDVTFIRYPGSPPAAVKPVDGVPDDSDVEKPVPAPWPSEVAERAAFYVWRRNGGHLWARPAKLRKRIPAEWWDGYKVWLRKHPWPTPLPAWYWAWQDWLDAKRRGERKQRPRTAPRVIPAWAWARDKARKRPQ